MTSIDQAELDLQRACDRLVAQNVQCCLSSLVATLAQGYARLEATHAARKSGFDLPDLCEQAFELASPIDDYEEAAQQAGWSYDKDDGRWSIVNDDGHETTLASTAREACELHGIDPYQREVFEHWAISAYLAGHLESQGEKIDRDFAGLTVWARTTTGQAIGMDGCIRAIVRKMMKTPDMIPVSEALRIDDEAAP